MTIFNGFYEKVPKTQSHQLLGPILGHEYYVMYMEHELKYKHNKIQICSTIMLRKHGLAFKLHQ